MCSYDRAGLAWSDSGPADETVEQTIADLHTLLGTAGEKAPYLLVGASIGGIYIRAYQRAFPDEVAGLIFTNSSNRVGESEGRGASSGISLKRIFVPYTRCLLLCAGICTTHLGERRRCGSVRAHT